MIVFAVEPFLKILHELPALFGRHYEEIAEDKDQIPLDPDYGKYTRLADAGILRIITVRNDGVLSGYAFILIDTHLHYRSTKFAAFDIYWLDPSIRGGRTAARFFRFIEGVLKAEGVVKAVCGCKIAHNHSRLFAWLGWRSAEFQFVKVL